MEKIEIKKILNQKYSRENWKNLSKMIFDGVEFFREPVKLENQNDKILDFLQIGNLILENKKKIALFEVKLKKNLNIYKNKVELRNLVINYIDQVTNHGVLVIYDNQGDNYRLTFSTKYSELGKDGSLLKVESEAKRYTYLLGETESCSTAAERFSLLKDRKGSLKIEDLLEAFSVEKVSSEFFDSYKKLCLDIEQDLKNLRKQDKKINQDFKNNNLEEINFSKKLLGQIVFIYFLQKKGWLGIKKDKFGNYGNWGSGDKIFFKNLFEKKYSKYDNFFNDILEPLFYEGLGSERKDEIFSLLGCKIPFLNGGLFEPIKNYDWSQTEITLSNDVFKKLIEVFDRYNFTVQEEDPEEKEIAIDPEMIGRVFENLLPENIRKSGGSFYTPRSIVNYMCEESIFYHLKENIKEKIDSVSLNDFVCKVSFDIKKSSKIYSSAGLIDELLRKIKICDPAIGSGAFPVSMMNLIVRLRMALSPYVERKYKNSSYYFKKDCIQNSIYGVDVDDSAIEIAKLRLWLSLVVDEDDYEKIEPLPNLDFKIVQGNSLLETFENFKLGESIFENPEKTSLEDYLGEQSTTKLLSELADLQSVFFKTISHNKKKLLKKEIEEKIFNVFKTNVESRKDFNKSKINMSEIELNDLISGKVDKNFFPWKIFFSEVFLNNKGFDVVIGNPPYIGVKEISKLSWREQLKTNFDFVDDLYSHFTFLAFLISKPNGIVAFITSDTFMTLQTKLNLRKKILENKLLCLAPTPKAFSAMVDTCIFIAQKKKEVENYNFNFLDLKNLDSENLENIQKIDMPGWEFFLNQVFLNKKIQNTTLVDSDIYAKNINSVFFNPNKKNLKIRNSIIPGIKKIYDRYWPAIKTSLAISQNIEIIKKYNSELNEGDITLLGLVTNGAVGMQTGDNGDFVGCVEDSIEANRVYSQRPVKLFSILKEQKSKICKKFPELEIIDSLQKSEIYLSKASEKKIRELFWSIKQFLGRDIFGQGFLYKIIKKNEIKEINQMTSEEKSAGINAKEKIYVKYDKGDKEGNRWVFDTPYYIKWDFKSVNFLKTSDLARWQGHNFFFKTGFCWSDVHTTYLKSRIKEESVHDVTSMSLSSVNSKIDNRYLVCLINSKFIAEYQENFLNNSSHFQINDARKLPIVVPTKELTKKFIDIFQSAKKIKYAFYKKEISFDEQIVALSKIEKSNDILVEKIYGF